MRKLFLIFVAALCTLLGSQAYAITDWFHAAVDFGFGYRHGDFKWSIAGPEGFPDVRTDVHWKNLQIFDLMLNAELAACDHLYARIRGNWGAIYDGRSVHTTFAGDHRTILLAESTQWVDGNWVYDSAAGFGYQFGSRKKGWEFAPLAGVSVSGQKLQMKDANEIFNVDIFQIGPIPHLTNKYKTMWVGGWLGADAAIHLNCWHIYGQFEHHWVSYIAQGRWHRDGLFKEHYNDKSTGNGQVAMIGINYQNATHWAIGVQASAQHWRTNKNGIHKVNSFSSVFTPPEDEFVGTLPVDPNNPLNSISWRCYTVVVTLDTYF